MRVPQCRKNLDRREPPATIELASFGVFLAGGCRSDRLDLQEPNAAFLEPGFGISEKSGTMSFASRISPDRNAMDVPGIREVFAQRQESDQRGPSESAKVGMVAESRAYMSSAGSIPNHMGKERSTASQSPARSSSGPMISTREAPPACDTYQLLSVVTSLHSAKCFRFADPV